MSTDHGLFPGEPAPAAEGAPAPPVDLFEAFAELSRAASAETGEVIVSRALLAAVLDFAQSKSDPADERLSLAVRVYRREADGEISQMVTPKQVRAMRSAFGMALRGTPEARP